MIFIRSLLSRYVKYGMKVQLNYWSAMESINDYLIDTGVN